MSFPPDFYTALHRGNPGDVQFYRKMSAGQGRILELGCGAGRVTAHLAGAAQSVIGIESHPGMLERARAATQHLNHVDILQGDMQAMEDWGLFDRILVPFTGLFCLERSALTTCLAQIHDRLTPGGALIFDVYPPEIYHDSDLDEVPYEWRTDIEVQDVIWSVDERISIHRDRQEIQVSYRHHRSEDTRRIEGPTYTIQHHYVRSHEWSPILYDAGFDDWFFWGDFEGSDPTEDSDLLVCQAIRGA